MTPNKRIFLNIMATYGWSLYALVCGLFCGRWSLRALGEIDYGLFGLIGGLTLFVAFVNNLLSSVVGRDEREYVMNRLRRFDLQATPLGKLQVKWNT